MLKFINADDKKSTRLKQDDVYFQCLGSELICLENKIKREETHKDNMICF